MSDIIIIYMANIVLTIAGNHIKQKYSKWITKSILELIKNSLDADATKISVDFIKNSAGWIDSIIVTDNWHGMSYTDAIMNFWNLGYSNKSTTFKSPSGRNFLWKLWEWRIFSLWICSKITWISKYKKESDNKNYIFNIINENSKGEFKVDDEEQEINEESWMRVIIENINTKALKKFDIWSSKNEILYELAYYLQAYESENILITYDAEELNLKDALASEWCNEDITIKDLETGDSHIVKVQLFHWKDIWVHSRYFIDKDNEIIHQDPHTNFSAKDFGHSVFVSWEIIKNNTIALMLENSLGKALSEWVRSVIEKYYLQIYKKRAAEFVNEIRDEEYYPYEWEPKNQIEESEREIFDIALFEVAANSRQFSKDSAETKAIVTNLIKTTIQRDVKDLIPILEETLKLPDEDIKKFKTLIESYGLSHLINTTKSITDKLSFIDELDTLLHNPTYQKITLERQHIHKLIENELWIFWDWYIWWTSDKMMRDVLKNHLKLLWRDNFIWVDTEWLSSDRPDIMLNKQYPQTSEWKFEHLVVELKRPSLKITQAELGQIQSYAAQVSFDERFNTTDVKWKFILLWSNWYDKSIDSQRNQIGKPKGLITATENYEVWVFTWWEILQWLRWKFDYLYEKLKESTPDPEKFIYLSENYPEIYDSIKNRLQ